MMTPSDSVGWRSWRALDSVGVSPDAFFVVDMVRLWKLGYRTEEVATKHRESNCYEGEHEEAR